MEILVSNFNKIDKKECELQIPHAELSICTAYMLKLVPYFPLVAFESNDMELHSINFIRTTMNIAICQKNPLFIHKLLNPFPVQIIVNWNVKMSTSSTSQDLWIPDIRTAIGGYE